MVVLQGGLSSEREVSLNTGKAMTEALRKKGYRPVPLVAEKDLVSALVRKKPDVVMIGLHGKLGEDGTVQGLLECMGIPYTGSGVMASAISMNKILTKKIIGNDGIPTPDFIVYESKEDLTGKVIKEIKASLIYPKVIKAQAEGSSRGTSVVHNVLEFDVALRDSLKYDDIILIENFIEGQQITVPILGKQVFPIVEIIPKSGFSDYHAKYTKGASEFIVPARLKADTKLKAEEISLKVFHLLQCRGYGRADFMVDKEGRLWFIEMNTLPGMTATSLFPLSAQQAGVSFEDLIERILLEASLDHARLYEE